MTAKALKDLYITDLVKGWAERIGHREALSRLVLRGVSISTADKLIRGKYLSQPGEMLKTILKEEMGKDQFFSKEVN